MSTTTIQQTVMKSSGSEWVFPVFLNISFAGFFIHSYGLNVWPGGTNLSGEVRGGHKKHYFKLDLLVKSKENGLVRSHKPKWGSIVRTRYAATRIRYAATRIRYAVARMRYAVARIGVAGIQDRGSSQLRVAQSA